MKFDKSRIVIAVEDGVKPWVYFLDKNGEKMTDYKAISMNLKVSQLVTELYKLNSKKWRREVEPKGLEL